MLGQLDALMADDQIVALMTAYGGQAAPAIGPMAIAQVGIYGAARFEQLGRYINAMQAVRDLYMAAFEAAQSNPDFVATVPRMVKRADEFGSVTVQQATTWDDHEPAPRPVFDRVFDAEAFTNAYESQPGLANQAFKGFYGKAYNNWTLDDSETTQLTYVGFENNDYGLTPQWHCIGGGKLVALDLNHPADLIDPQAVAFDPMTGCFGTLMENLEDDDAGLFGTVVTLTLLSAVAFAAAPLAAQAAAGMGLSGAGAYAAAGAITGLATSTASGLMSGDLKGSNLFSAALSGALTAGLVGSPVSVLDNPVGAVGRALVQGGIQALTGGNFEDGAIASFFSGLASDVGANLDAAISQADPSEAFALRLAGRAFTAGIRAIGQGGVYGNNYIGAFIGESMQRAGIGPKETTLATTGGVVGVAGTEATASPNAAPIDTTSQSDSPVANPSLPAISAFTTDVATRRAVWEDAVNPGPIELDDPASRVGRYRANDPATVLARSADGLLSSNQPDFAYRSGPFDPIPKGMYEVTVTTDDLGRQVSYTEYPSNVMMVDEQGQPVIPTRHTDTTLWRGATGSAVDTSDGIVNSSPRLGIPERVGAHANGLMDVGAGLLESQAYSLGFIGTPQTRAHWALAQADSMLDGIKRFASDPVGSVTGWWRDLTGDDAEAIRHATLTGAGAALEVVGRGGAGRGTLKGIGAELEAGSHSRLTPGGGLQAHEDAGGHLLEKHIGKTDTQLENRLSKETQIDGASSFYDRSSGERAISEALDANQPAISAWLAGKGKRLILTAPLSEPAGVSFMRGATNAVDAGSVRMVLVREPNLPTGYKIFTGFPVLP